MKKIIISFSILAILAIITVFIINHEIRQNHAEWKNVAITDTASITGIIISEQGKSVTLKKGPEYWIINDKYSTNHKAIHNILTTVYRLSMKMPVPKSELENVNNKIQTRGIEVSLFSGDNKLISYLIGNYSEKQKANYLKVKNTDQPIFAYIPGYKGQLKNIFVPEEQFWRDKSIFKYKPEQIKQIKVEYFQNPSQSFILKKNENSYTIQLLQEKKIIKNPDIDAITRYLSYFANFEYFAIDMEISESKKDSILNSEALHRITVTDADSVNNSILTFKKPLLNPRKASRNYDFDPDNIYIANDNNTLLIAKYIYFDLIARQADYFKNLIAQ